MIAIIDYEAGNLLSVERAVRKSGFDCKITMDKDEVLRAEKIIFPGVGAAGKAMENMKRLGLDWAMREAFVSGTPILGICLGAQIIFERSEENRSRCLGFIEGEVKRFPIPLNSKDGQHLKVPHMGWNRVTFRRKHPIQEGIRPGDEFYFVHSYYPVPASHDVILGQTDYGITFPSVIECNNLIAVQFHLEKSGHAGLRIFQNFCQWKCGHA